MAEFIIYRAAGGAEIRARVRTTLLDGSQTVEPFFFRQDGTDVPGFIGGRKRVPAAQVVEKDPVRLLSTATGTTWTFTHHPADPKSGHALAYSATGDAMTRHMTNLTLQAIQPNTGAR